MQKVFMRVFNPQTKAMVIATPSGDGFTEVGAFIREGEQLTIVFPEELSGQGDLFPPPQVNLLMFPPPPSIEPPASQ